MMLLPRTLLWRSVMQLVGGAGLAIVMLAALTRPILAARDPVLALQEAAV